MRTKTQKKMFNRVAIIGLGLMGASLGLALKRIKIAKKVVGFARRAETRKEALAKKNVDIAYDRIEAAVQGSDFIVLCVPVSVIPGMLKSTPGEFLSPNAIVTDVGSVKAHIVAEAEKAFADGKARFVGSHPIAGSEQRGLEAARADLYRGAVVVVTPTQRTSPRALRIVRQFWQALGSEVVLVSPEIHDRIIARTSHLPHVIAALLAGCVGRERAGKHGKFCGAGFRDTTRIAEGDPELWRDILENNASYLRKELETFEKEMRRLLAGLKKGNNNMIKKCLSRGRERRQRLLAARHEKKDTRETA
ncbi:MAG: prephenate dehydrogenase/arogenate dehydrogenase family protein [Kiritimatiellia bacterium]|nr:prephenate dehydrogenase/arogenate dehydrogenase family protein [Kiritimatiellia bacterium]